MFIKAARSESRVVVDRYRVIVNCVAFEVRKTLPLWQKTVDPEKDITIEIIKMTVSVFSENGSRALVAHKHHQQPPPPQ